MINAYIIAAKRSAIGRIGGLHKSRRLPDLASSIAAAALAEARLDVSRIEAIVLGNASESGNPARLVALAAGLPERAGALTVDRQCASGLDAILTALRTIAAGEADAILAGGAESLSTAPWRVSRPRNPIHPPRFIAFGPDGGGDESSADHFAPFDAAAAKLRISRKEQDVFAHQSFERAQAAREAGQFLSEIVPIRHNAEEARDQSSIEAALDELAEETPFAPPAGTATPANTSALHDGAAFVVAVSERVWRELGCPPALRLLASAAEGVGPSNEAEAAPAAFDKLLARHPSLHREAIGVVELNERTAGEAIAFAKAAGIGTDILNPAGGAIARGHPYGAAGAVLVTRLFSRLARSPGSPRPEVGVVALGAFGGQGLAAAFARAE